MVNKELCKLCGKPKEEHYYSEKGILCINGFELLGSRFTPLPQDVSIEGERNNLAVYNEGFQKGKLEERERISELINAFKEKVNKFTDFKQGQKYGLNYYLEQLQKEIGEEKQDE